MSENAASSQDTIFTLFKEFETKMMRHFDRLEHKIDAVTIMCRDEHSMYSTKHVVPGTVNSSCSMGVSQNQPASRSDEVQFVGLKSEIADDFPRKISYISELLRDVLEMFSTKATAETIRDREENMSNASNGSILLVAPQRLQTTALVCNDNNSHPPIPVGQIQPALMPQESTKVNSNNNCGTLLSSHPTITKPHKGPLDSQKRKREGIKGDKAMTTTGSTKLKSDTFPKPNATAPKRNRESMSGSQTPQVVRKGSSKSRRLEDEIRIAKQRMSALDTARQTHESTPNPNIHLLSVDRSPCSIEMLRQLRDQELIHALTQDKVSFPKSDIYTVLNERHLGTSMAISSCVAEYLRHCPAASMYAMKRSQRTMLREIYTVHGMCFVDELFRICGKVLLDKSLLSALASNEVVSICTGLGILADLSDRGGLVRLLTVRMLKSCSSQFPDITFKVVQALCYSSMAWGSKEASVVSRGLLHTSLHMVLQTLFGLSESSSLLEMCDHCGWPQRPMYDCDDLLHICAERLNRASISQPDLEALESFKLIILLCKDFQQSLRFLQLHFLDSPWCLSIVLDIFVHKDENCISSIDRSSAGLPKGDTKSLSLVSGHPILESAKRMVQPTLRSDPSTLGNNIVACLVLLGCYREHDFERERIVAIVKNYIQKNVSMFKGTIEGVPRSYLREFYSIVETVTGGFAKNKAETP